MVSELTVGESPNITYKRKETRGDSKTRTFIYGGAGYINWIADFMGHSAQQHYDATTKYVDYVVDRRGNRTDYTCDPLTGNVTQVQLPLTNGDTPGQGNTRPTINYTYTNSYYLHTIQDEGNHTTTFTRNGNNRVIRVDYPDDGYETFGYDASHFYQISSHRMTTGGTESWTYDAQHRKDTYRNPDNASGNPTARYIYGNYDRVSDITDVLGTSVGDQNHTTSFAYNLRAQITVTTLPKDPVDNVRHTIRNSYNDTGNNAGDGTLVSMTDQLNHTTTYTSDDYRRLKSVTPPVRGFGDNGTYTTSFYYGANPWDGVADYKLTDSNVTWVVPPTSSFRKIHPIYDDNRRKSSVTVAPGTSEEATTSYTYDNVGNVTWVTNPLDHNNVHTLYDERNRPYSISVGGQTTTVTYDTSGRTKTITRPNGQVITNVSFDAMNRATEQSATQSPTATGRTTYAYYPGSGLLQTFQDPHLYNSNPPDQYSYTYDGMGRRRTLTYPAEAGTGVHRVERWDYDGAGRLDTYTTRGNKHQSFTYDGLNRMTDFSWDDGLTPSVHFTYDVASRLTGINNANANITRGYYYDNLLRSETEQILLTGGRTKTTSYAYDADGNRASITYPDGGYAFGYTYTNRNQLKTVNNWASYDYDPRGNLLTRTLVGNGKHSDYIYDARDRVTWITHTLNVTRGFNYGYQPNSDNRKYAKRTWTGLGEVFAYDLADQVTAVQHNIANPNTTPVPGQNIYYDSNGNRTWYAPPEINKHYDVNGTASNLNQYNNVTINGSPYNLTYRPDANLASYGYNTASYYYDAQNRVTSATVGGQSMYFDYDGLNRQVSRRIGANGTRTFNVWDGWDLIEEYQGANATAFYLYGATGLIASTANGQFNYYFQDGSGSTSHVTDENGTLKEWYRYDLQGSPFIYDANNNQLSTTNRSVRHLFTGQQWYGEVGLYDLRNRFYSPDLGRLLQPDPIGFRGGNNLYRYCRNNPVTQSDPFGLQDAVNRRLDGGGDVADYEPQYVNGESPNTFWREPLGFGGLGGGPGGGGGDGPLSGNTFRYGIPPRNSNSNTQQQPPPQNPQAPAIDIFHPKTTAEFILAGNIIEHGDTTDTTPAIDPIDLLSGGIAALVRSSFRSVVAKVIGTPYGRAIQSTSAEARAALRQVEGGATVYKGGVLGRSETSASQFFSLENPLNPGYAGRYGMPPQNSNFDFILSGRVQPGAPVITRPAPGIPPNLGEGIEAVTNPGSFRIDSFYMPD
jgi:RHS repeat-associated protein